MERLEDRITPADHVDAGGLRFLADVKSGADFTQNGNEYSVSKGVVSVGYVPTGSENYLALVQVQVGTGTGAGLAVNTGTASFKIKDSTMALTVVGGKTSAPIPIWQTPDASTPVNFPIATLSKGSGVSLSDAMSKKITVASTDFRLSLLQFVNPAGGDTSDAKVQMQGNVSFDQLPVTNGLNGAKFEVNGFNYVVADKQGITLTGIEAKRDLPSDTTIGGMAVSGEITIGYKKPEPPNTIGEFTFGGGVSLSSTPQGSNKKVGFDHVGAELNFTLTEENGALAVDKLGFEIDGSFKVFGLTVSTIAGKPLDFQWVHERGQYEISGGLQAEFRGNKIGVSLGKPGDAGLLISDGEVTQLIAKVTANFELFEAKVSTGQTGGLNFEYDRENDQFEMYGGLTLAVPTTNTTTQITAQMGTSAKDPGLVIVGGELQRLDLALTGQFDLYGLALAANGAGCKWVAATGTQGDTLGIYGEFSADFKVFQTSTRLGTEDKPGLTIADGKFAVDDLSFELDNAELGPITLNEMKVSYTAAGASFDLGVDVSVGLPGGWTVGGDFEFVEGRFDSISLSFRGTPGVAIGPTGLLLTEIAASVKNIENPSKIVVSGRVDLVYGETIKMLGRDVNLFHAEGQFTVDANEFVLDCDVQIGAYSTDNGNTWQGVLGRADGNLTLDWHDNVYSLHVEADGILGIFDVEGDLVFAAGRDIQLLATAEVVVPTWVPFIGGDTLGGLGFYFEHVWPRPNVGSSTTLAAWIDLDVIWPFTVGLEIVIDSTGAEHFSVIGGGTVDGFKQSVKAPTDQTYTFTTDLSGVIPAAATYATVSVDWSHAAPGVAVVGRPTFRVQRVSGSGTQVFTEDRFAANGISFISDSRFNGKTSAAIQIVGSATDPDAPITGQYSLLVDIKTEGGNPSPPGQGYPAVEATYHIPKPTFGPLTATAPYAPPLPTASPSGTFPVTLTGSIDEAFLGKATVALYRVRADDPFQRGVLVGSSALAATTPAGGLNWRATIDVPIDGLDPTAYTLYAVLTDGFTTPKPGESADGSGAPGRAIQSGLSAPFTPLFAVQGELLNQHGDREFGWELYLDYNSNGTHDANEPVTTTNRDGFYSFTRTFDPSTGWTPVPVGRPFHVQLILPANVKNFAPIDPARPVTYHGTEAAIADYGLQEKSAIKGNVFIDLLNDGNAAHGRGAAGAVVYLDANGNGRRDPGEPTAVADSVGDYAFADVAAGTYKVVLDLASLSLTTPVAAYDVAAGTVGNHTDNLTLGMSFQVDKPTVVTGLGVFDSKGDGFSGTLTAVLYDATTKAVVARATFTPGAPGTLQGGTRFVTLAEPITLMPGFKGIIAAYGFSAQDPWGSSEPAPWALNAGAGQLVFTGTGVSGPVGQFPTIVGGNTVTNPYAAGSFLFREAPWAASSPGATPYTVTIDASGFDLEEGKDFGVLPPSFIAGTVSGHPLVGGQPQPGTNPLAGWTVQLLTDTPIARINAGGGAVGNYNTDTHFSGGSTGETTAAIDTSHVFDPAPQAVYQNNRYGANGTAFSYTIAGLTPQAPLGVRLHFAEPFWGAPGERQFHVTINGQRVLSEFDVFQAAGGKNTAVVRSFDTFVDASGGVTIVFTPGRFGDPFVNGIELFRPGAVVATTTTDAQGNYVFTQHPPGDYTVREVLPAGWRQASPFHSDLRFTTTSTLGEDASGGEPVLADFNGDGYLDVAVATNRYQGGNNANLSVFFNQKNNTFSHWVDDSIQVFGTVSIAAGDLNGDGWIDLVVLDVKDGADSSVNAYLNTGVDESGKRFQFAPNYWSVPSEFISAAGTLSFPTLADLNSDGRVELLLGYNTRDNTTASVLVLKNPQDAAHLVTEYKLPRVNLYGVDEYTAGPMVVADYNGDGFPDVFVNGGMHSLEYSHLNVALGDGKGSLDPWQSYALPDIIGSTLGPTAAGDVTGIGLPSVVAIVRSDLFLRYGYWDYWLNRGDGSFDLQVDSSQAHTPLAPAPTRVLVTDVDGDLKPDLVYLLAGGTGVDSILVYLNVGTAPYYELSNPLVFPIDGGFEAGYFAVGDVNNDGLLDLIVTGESRGGGRVVLNQSGQNEPGLPVFLGAGSIKAGADFVNVQTPGKAAVHGQVFEDANRNGGRDTGEAGAAGTFVFVDLNRNRRYDAGEPSAATIAGGYYAIPGLADGTYSVGLFAEDGWRAATPASEFTEVTIANGVPAQVDIGRVRRLLAEVSPLAVRVGEALREFVPLTAEGQRHRLTYSLEGPVPEGLSINPATGEMVWAPTTAVVGTHSVTVRVRDPFNPLVTETREVTVEVTHTPVPRVVAVAGVGGPPLVRVYDAAGNPVFTATPFGPQFGGGIRVAAGDVNGDGVDDVVAAAGPGGGPHVVVYDGAAGHVLASLFVFEPGFTGGVHLAVGDVNGDGFADIVVGAGPGGGPHVRVLSGRDMTPLADFFAFDPGFTGGVSLAVGDVNGDGFADIAVGAGPGGGPHVRVFDGRTQGELASFLAFTGDFRGGVLVTTGDVNGDGFADLIVAAGPGGGSHVRVFDGRTGGELASFLAFADDSRDGVSLAVGDVNGDGFADIAVGAGPGGGPRVAAFAVPDALAGSAGQVNRLADFFVGNPAYRGGARVAVTRLDEDADADLLVGTGGRVVAYSGASLAGGAPSVAFELDPFPDFNGGVGVI